MTALILDTNSSSGSGGRPIRFLHRSCRRSARLERTRLVELVIDTVVCLTLAKWETVSGQFGGYLSPKVVIIVADAADGADGIFGRRTDPDHPGSSSALPEGMAAHDAGGQRGPEGS